MSWYTTGEVRNGEEVEALELSEGNAFGDQSPQVREQFQTAKGLAKQLVDSGVVGGTPKLFRVHLSGHANPGHEPKSGMANDTVTVTVAQL